MKKRSGITLTMLVIYMVILSIIMGAVVLNLGYNNEIEELDKSTYQARILDYIEQFTTMKNYYTIKGEYNDEIMTRQNEQDIYGRTIADYIGSITMEDKEYLCIYNGELHTFGMDTEDTRYGYIQELGITQIEYIPPVDNVAPTVTITPNTVGITNSVTVKITVSDNKQLASNNTYQYYLSTSRTTQIGGSWINYTNGTAFTIGTGLTGTYYLHVKPVYDKAGNTSGNVVSNAYNFDNENPTILANILEENGIHNIQITLSDTQGIDLTKSRYTISQGRASLGTSVSNYDKAITSTNQTIQVGVCGIYYLHILATDTTGNTQTYISDAIVGNNLTYGQVESETTYSYMNSVQEEKLDKGVYKLEVWGAAGGSTSTNSGGQGGYSVGVLLLKNTADIYIVTGGVGGNNNGITGGVGGYNGGGNGGNGETWWKSGGSGGGGATHIATSTGTLSELNEKRESILIVAGGGGAPGANNVTAGNGGGLSGENGSTYGGAIVYGGTQTTGYAFGQGMNGGNASGHDYACGGHRWRRRRLLRWICFNSYWYIYRCLWSRRFGICKPNINQ